MPKKLRSERDLNAFLRSTLPAKGLEIRFTLLSSEFCIGQTLPYNVAHCQAESIKVIHRVVRSCAIIVAEYLLIHIAVKVEWFDGNVGSADPALQQTPEVFNPVGVDAATDVL